MKIKSVIESVVDTSLHRWVVHAYKTNEDGEAEHIGENDRGIVHLANHTETKHKQVAEHMEAFKSEAHGMLPNHEYASQKLRAPHEVVNHTYGHQWFDKKEDGAEHGHLEFRHKFTPTNKLREDN